MIVDIPERLTEPLRQQGIGSNRLGGLRQAVAVQMQQCKMKQQRKRLPAVRLILLAFPVDRIDIILQNFSMLWRQGILVLLVCLGSVEQLQIGIRLTVGMVMNQSRAEKRAEEVTGSSLSGNPRCTVFPGTTIMSPGCIS